MNIKRLLGLTLAIAPLCVAGQALTGRQTLPFNDAWRFTNTEIFHAEQVDFADSEWRTVNLPHDWSIEDLPNQIPDTVAGPFSRHSTGRASTGWTVGGTGWYRKTFTSGQAWNGKHVSIHFDGVYMNADIWLNGYHIGEHPYGYTPFHLELTPYLKPAGQENVLAVRVRNEGRNSRWYSGSGIYRSVFLTVTEPVHVDTWGVQITTPEVSKDNAAIYINTAISNEENDSHTISLVTTIIAPDGKEVGEARTEHVIASRGKDIVSQEITLAEPALWSLDSPSLYKAITEIREENTVKDRVETSFGIRSIAFDAEKGFLLNGEAVLLRGGCIHHDNGPLGSAAFARAEERKVEILKRNGFNAIRSSHNPASTALLEACDRLGMLIIEEAFDTWVRPKNPQDYNLYFNEWWQEDLDAMILRGQNHPSVIAWSIGNEVYEISDLLGQELAGKLSSEIRQLDSTRPVTSGIVYLPPFTKQVWEKYEPSLAHLDIDGYNYFLETHSDFFIRDSLTLNRFDTEHTAHPKKVFYGSETLAVGALENWDKAEAVPYVLGCFKWTAFDYIGEAGIGMSRYIPQNRPAMKGLMGMGAFARDEWPVFNAFCGDFDLTGNKKAASYYQDVVWRISPVELLVHKPFPEGMKEWVAPWGFTEVVKSWSWPGHEGEKMQVNVYTRSEKVRLELNGKVIAEQTVPQGEITAVFEVAYQPGVLVAKSMDGGKVTGTSRLTTAGKSAAIRLTAEQPANKAEAQSDLVYIQVEIVDEKGDVVPCMDDMEIYFELEGEATLAATGNGSPVDMSGFQQPRRKVYQGKALVIIRPAGNRGTAVVKATAEGLRSGTVRIELN